MIGARDMAFPRLNALSFWLLLAGGIVFYASIFWNPPEAGWTSCVPLANAVYSPSGGEDAWIYLIHLTGLSSILGAINFYATIANMRARGMSWGRLPLFVWTILTYSVLLIFAMPVIAAAVTMLLTDRHFGTHFFDPAQGGSPILWQHLFWFFGHPEVYIMVLPGFGDDLGDPAGVRAQADLRLQGDRGVDRGDRLPGLPHVGAPHVHGADTRGDPRVRDAQLLLDRRAHGGEDPQLGRDAVARHDRIQDAAAVLRGRHRAVPDRRASRASSWPRSRSTGRSTKRTSWWRTCISCCMGGAVFTIFAAIYYWFPKITGRMLSEGLGKLSF